METGGTMENPGRLWKMGGLGKIRGDYGNWGDKGKPGETMETGGTRGRSDQRALGVPEEE